MPLKRTRNVRTGIGKLCSLVTVEMIALQVFRRVSLFMENQGGPVGYVPGSYPGYPVLTSS